MLRRLLLPLLLGFLLVAPIADAPLAQVAQSFNARAVVSIASSGANTVITGVANKQIYIFGLDLSTASTTTVQFKSGSTALTGVMTLNAYSKGLIQGGSAYWVTAAGDDFVITLGGNVQTSGTIWYLQQ